MPKRKDIPQMPTQGELLRDKDIFSTYGWLDMNNACKQLDAGLNSSQPLQLLLIVHAITQIGEEK